MRFGIGILLLTLLVLAAGCQQAAQKAAEGMAERAIEAQSGGKISADISGDTVTITDKETGGETLVQTGKGGQRMPEGWPAELPKYPGSTILSSTRQEADEGVAFHVMLHTSATAAEVADFYAKKAKAAGFSQMNKTETPDGFSLYYDSETRGFAVTAIADDDGCDVALQLVPK